MRGPGERALVPSVLVGARLRQLDAFCVVDGCGQPHPWRYCWAHWRELTPRQQSDVRRRRAEAVAR